jgi:hypothetical protein
MPHAPIVVDLWAPGDPVLTDKGLQAARLAQRIA